MKISEPQSQSFFYDSDASSYRPDSFSNEFDIEIDKHSIVKIVDHNEAFHGWYYRFNVCRVTGRDNILLRHDKVIGGMVTEVPKKWKKEVEKMVAEGTINPEVYVATEGKEKVQIASNLHHSLESIETRKREFRTEEELEELDNSSRIVSRPLGRIQKYEQELAKKNMKKSTKKTKVVAFRDDEF